MKALVEKLRETYDYVIIDTPPVGPVIDAKVAMQLADKVIFVVRWQTTTREMVAQSIDGLNAGAQARRHCARRGGRDQGAALRALFVLFQLPLQKLLSRLIAVGSDRW